MSAPRQAMRTSSRNHNHTRTVPQGRTSRPAPTNAHNNHSTKNNIIAYRLDMQTPSTPPTRNAGAPYAFAPNGEATQQPAPPTSANYSSPAKFGSSPRAPSFASVVSSSTAVRAPAKSPLSPPRDACLQSPLQKQEQAQTQEQPASHSQTPQEHFSTTAIDHDGSHTLGDNLSSAPAIAGQETEPQGTQLFSPEGLSDHDSPRKVNSPTETCEDQNHDNELEDSDSSDVEIHLPSVGLHDSASRMHVLYGHATTSIAPIGANSITLTQPEDDSPVIPSTMQLGGDFAAHTTTTSTVPSALRLGGVDQNGSSSHSHLSFSIHPSNASPPSSSHLYAQQYNTQNSPRVPAAPVDGMVSLPQMDDREYMDEVEARQQHNLQQHQNFYQSPPAQLHQPFVQSNFGAPISVHNTDTIDLSAVGSTIGNDQQLCLPPSHSQPALTVEPPYADSNMLSGNGPAFPTSVSDSGISASSCQKTPNVYINGLPPHFRDDQLLALTNKFGAIRSVRTFTRHVRDSESGYGFVLFETIEAAERCIAELRCYRNLHPTFSKQIHKIPGTTYAQGTAASSTAATWNNESPGSDAGSHSPSNTDSFGNDASFKAKMESLQDPTSTNLYMEGLPLSLDDVTLAELVKPHLIISSRLFRTRLSNPPRIIAFVRLDTRKGAEEVIERLHGRKVRGWNEEEGSRISVRFADTSEQRELRRMERSAQEGDTSPSRLTIAQASLLNLRGKDLGPGHIETSAHLPLGNPRGFAASASAPDFASNKHLAPDLEVDYSLVPGRVIANPRSRSRSPYQAQHGLGYQQSELPNAAQTQSAYGMSYSPGAPTNSAMSTLINSFSNMNMTSPAVGAYADGQSGLNGNYLQTRGGYGHLLPPVGHRHLTTSQSADNVYQYTRPAPVYTRSGYTPTEESIMRAHAENAAFVHAQQQQQAATERRRPAPLDLGRQRSDENEFSPANIAVGMRGYRAQASVGRLGQELLQTTNPIGTLPSSHHLGMGVTAEDDSRSSMRNDFSRTLNANMGEGDMNKAVGSTMDARHNPNLHPAHVNVRLSRDQVPVSAPSASQSYSHIQSTSQGMSPMLPSTLQDNSPNLDSPNINQAINYHHATTHMRSTTLPQHRTSSARDGQLARGHYQHNSMSMPAQNLRTPQHASVAAFSNNGGIDGANMNSGTIYEDGSAENQRHQRQSPESQISAASSSVHRSAPAGQNAYGEMDTSPSTGSLISPTLTYGTQTPSTLSPATPFFGSFSNQGDVFDKGANGGMEGQYQKKANTSNGVGQTPLRT